MEKKKREDRSCPGVATLLANGLRGNNRNQELVSAVRISGLGLGAKHLLYISR